MLSPVVQGLPNFMQRGSTGLKKLAGRVASIIFPEEDKTTKAYQWRQAHPSKWTRMCLQLREIQESEGFTRTFMVLILINIATMAAEHDNQPDSWTRNLRVINTIFTACFTVEIVVKVVCSVTQRPYP